MRGSIPFAPFAVGAAALAAALGCTTVGRTVANACPESRSLRCATPPVCSLDRARGCMVCGCEAWDPAAAAKSEQGGRTYQPERDPARGPSDVAPPPP
jgi:hypothetical protein